MRHVVIKNPILAYAKNHGLGFAIPYAVEGIEHQYIHDYLVHIDDGHGAADPLQLIIEVTGERRPEKAAKVRAARVQWVPAIDHHGGFGRWAFAEAQDPYDTRNLLRAWLRLWAANGE